MRRSVAKIFYHAGFEELQPSALDTITEIAGDFLSKLVRAFNVFQEAEKKPASGVGAEHGARFQPRFTPEEVILHTLGDHGYTIEALDSYGRDEVDRLGSKLLSTHDRMKSHLADLLRPALNDAGPDGAGAFADGSEQFVGGDFAEELGEDFFGFKALGLDKEMGLEMLSVPLHLLQSRVRNQYQMQTQTTGTTSADLFEALPPLDPVTKENIQGHIGLVKNFFWRSYMPTATNRSSKMRIYLLSNVDPGHDSARLAKLYLLRSVRQRSRLHSPRRRRLESGLAQVLDEQYRN